MVDLEGETTAKGTLPDPLLGFFNSSCNLIAFNDDSGIGFNSRLVFTIPADGVFILAASSFFDFNFIGDHFSSGSYQLTITPSPPLIGSISGRVIDALTGEPLQGNAPPFASAILLQCLESECFSTEFMNSQPADSDGQFQFSSDFAGVPLIAGTYKVEAFADQYQAGQTDPFNVGEGEDKDVGDIPLTPFFVQFSEVQPCSNLSPLGGTCNYSVRVRNNSSTRLDGAVWSLVNSFGIGSFVDFTIFQTGKLGPQSPTPQKVALTPGDSKVFQFAFQVPGTVTDGVFICTESFVGQDPDPSFNTVGQRFLFCISKGVNGFTVVPEKKAREQFRQSRGKALGR